MIIENSSHIVSANNGCNFINSSNITIEGIIEGNIIYCRNFIFSRKRGFFKFLFLDFNENTDLTNSGSGDKLIYTYNSNNVLVWGNIGDLFDTIITE